MQQIKQDNVIWDFKNRHTRLEDDNLFDINLMDRDITTSYY